MARAEWASEATARMYQYEIPKSELAVKIGWTREYLSMLFTGKKTSKKAKSVIMNAIDELIEERKNAKSEAE